MAEPNLKMDFKGQHILSAKQFDKKGLLVLFEEAKKMERVLENGITDILKGKMMATLFFEPSTRTRFSFETAMQRLGGMVISNADMRSTSSFTKLETLEDTGKVISQLADVIIMRHPEPGSVAQLASKSDVPVINAGDGNRDHPTQGLLDVYTIWREKGGLDGLTIGMIGDLKNSRVLHAQAVFLKHFDVKFIYVAPEELRMPGDMPKSEKATENLEEFLGEMDVISMSRVQKERFESEAEYKKYAGVYVLDAEMMKKAKDDAIIIQPLPRVDEVSIEVDRDPRAKYFEQIKNGVAVRMALLKLILA